MYYIISAELSTLSERENIERTEELADLLEEREIPYQSTVGRFNGVKESSFVVFSEKVAEYYCKAFDQQCYMFVDRRGDASLHAPDGEPLTFLGRTKTVPHEPLNSDYTKHKHGYLIVT
ncbi:hypothetical protein OAF54_00280 [bacterium]|nr:hypothetical protein [bacterium]